MVKDYIESRRWTKKHWTAFFLLASAFLCAALFGGNDDPAVRTWSGACFGYVLGLSMALWGVIHFQDGWIKGRRRRYERSQNPGMFLFLMIFKIAIPALCGLVIGLYFTFAQPASVAAP